MATKPPTSLGSELPHLCYLARLFSSCLASSSSTKPRVPSLGHAWLVCRPNVFEHDLIFGDNDSKYQWSWIFWISMFIEVEWFWYLEKLLDSRPICKTVWRQGIPKPIVLHHICPSFHCDELRVIGLCYVVFNCWASQYLPTPKCIVGLLLSSPSALTHPPIPSYSQMCHGRNRAYGHPAISGNRAHRSQLRDWWSSPNLGNLPYFAMVLTMANVWFVGKWWQC